jgi:hypothetical protein
VPATALNGLVIGQGLTLSGLGTIFGDVTNSGVVDPTLTGFPVGALVITGNYTQTSTGRLNVGLQSTTVYYALNVGGVATLDGDLWVCALAGFDPCQGDQFTLLTANQIVGNFANYHLPALPAGRTWQTQLANARLVLTVQ